MIYLLTHPTTRHKVLIVKTISDLPADYNQTFDSSTGSYMIDNNVFANISLIPNNLQGTEEEVQTIAKNYFSDYVMKKFDSADFFTSYILYSIHNNELIWQHLQAQ